MAGGAARPVAARGTGRGGQASCKAHVEAMLAFHAQGIPTFDYGNNIRQVAHDEGARRRVRVPRFRAGVHPAAVLRRQGAVSLGRAVRRSRGHLQDRSQGQGTLSRRRALASLARHGARAHRVPGTAGAHLLARPGRATSRGTRVQRDGGKRRTEGADRDRPRSPRHRQRRESQSRDRGDAGRLGRGVRLAAAQRAARTRRAARRGCRCITAAAWAWATRSTRAS